MKVGEGGLGGGWEGGLQVLQTYQPMQVWRDVAGGGLGEER